VERVDRVERDGDVPFCVRPAVLPCGDDRELRFEGLLVQVTINIGGQEITSIITSDAARALGLKIGTSVYALIKATEVMVIRG